MNRRIAKKVVRRVCVDGVITYRSPTVVAAFRRHHRGLLDRPTDHAILYRRRLLPLPVGGTLLWAFWLRHPSRVVGRTTVGNREVSTVCLGLDHGFGPRQLFFETMVFAGGNDLEDRLVRYSTYREAEVGHKAIVEALRARLN